MRRGCMLQPVAAVLLAATFGLAAGESAPSVAAKEEPRPIPVEVLDSESYRQQLEALEADADKAIAARRMLMPRSRQQLKPGAGNDLPPGSLIRWRNQGSTSCAPGVAIDCADPRAPRRCTPGATCSAVINGAAQITNVHPAAARFAEVEARYGPWPFQNGAQEIGACCERAYQTELCLKIKCLRGDYGPGWSCEVTSQNVLDFSLTNRDGNDGYLTCLPEPIDSDGDGFPDGSDDCPSVPGVAPRGCPAPPPPPKPVCGDRACNGIETCASCPVDCGECLPPKPDLCPDVAEVKAWLDSICARPNIPTTGRAICGLRAVTSDADQRWAVCEARRWIRDTGHGGVQ